MIADLFAAIKEFLPLIISLIIVLFVLWLANRLLLKRKVKLNPETVLTRQMIMIGLSVLGLIFVLLSIPMSEATRGQILSLLGIVFTGIIAFSSSSLIANMMSGLMIRFIKSFHAGDFIRVNDQFGRVTEVGLMHTEIQTEDRDLVTLPNIYLMTNPVKVVRNSGTIISATVSLGYDVEHSHVEELMKKAAEAAGLKDPFVLVIDLGDFSVAYRIAGFLEEVKNLLTVRSNLRKQVLDTLHNAGIEIVSPNFMNTRNLDEKTKTIPRKRVKKEKRITKKEDTPEKIIFDKADEAENLEQQKEKFDEFKVSQSSLTREKWVLSPNQIKLNKIVENSSEGKKLSEIATIAQGVSPGVKNIFVMTIIEAKKMRLEKEILYPFITNKHISKWTSASSNLVTIFPKKITNLEEYPFTKAYLEKNREILINGSDRKKLVGKNKIRWFDFSVYRNINLFLKEREKILTPYRSKRVSFAYDNEGLLGSTDIYAIFPKKKELLFYLLGVLNSKISEFWFKEAGKKKGTVIEFFSRDLAKFPIPPMKNEKKITEVVKRIIHCNIKSEYRAVEELEKELNYLVLDEYNLEQSFLSDFSFS